MKRFMQVSGIVAVIFVSTFVSNALIGSARGGTVDCVSGDVTGDGKASLVDAIHLLNWLFLDGPDLVACAQDEDQVTNDPAPVCCWPPKPEDMVRVESSVTTIAGDSGLEVYEVPDDKAFIMTRFQLFSASTSTSIALSEDLDGEIVEKISGRFIPRLNFIPFLTSDMYSGNSALGISFAPGSTVSFENSNALSYTFIAYVMTGYLVDARDDE